MASSNQGERIKALETRMDGYDKQLDQTVDTITSANEQHHKTHSSSIKLLSDHITAETNRWLKAFYWIAFALMTVGGVTLGNTKLTEKILEVLFK